MSRCSYSVRELAETFCVAESVWAVSPRRCVTPPVVVPTAATSAERTARSAALAGCSLAASWRAG